MTWKCQSINLGFLKQPSHMSVESLKPNGLSIDLHPLALFFFFFVNLLIYYLSYHEFAESYNLFSLPESGPVEPLGRSLSWLRQADLT